MAASATIRVQFGNATNADGTANGHLSAEIDSRPTGLNSGQTAFSPGDDVYILVYRTENVTLDTPISSAGSISPAGSATVDITEDVTFEDLNTANVRVPIQGTISTTKWFGNNLGSLAVQADRMTLRADSKGVAVARITYQASADVYKLTSPATIDGLTDFTILVLIRGAGA